MTESPPCDGGIFVTLRRWHRVWAIASIHGEAGRLSRILDDIADRLEPGDRVVFLGNYLGYGPDVGGTLDQLIGFRRAFLALPRRFPADLVFLRGWQEEVWHKLVQLQFSVDPKPVFQWMLEHGMAPNLRAYGNEPQQVQTAMREGVMALTRWTGGLRGAIDARPGHRAFFSALRHAARTDDDKLLFVHAGYDPGKPLELQNDILWWGGTDLLVQNADFSPFSRIVRGFDRHHSGVEQTPFVVSVDGGAGFGGPLLAACFDRSGDIVQTLSD